jgi:hypothetical protein
VSLKFKFGNGLGIDAGCSHPDAIGGSPAGISENQGSEKYTGTVIVSSRAQEGHGLSRTAAVSGEPGHIAGVFDFHGDIEELIWFDIKRDVYRLQLTGIDRTGRCVETAGIQCGSRVYRQRKTKEDRYQAGKKYFFTHNLIRIFKYSIYYNTFFNIDKQRSLALNMISI